MNGVGGVIHDQHGYRVRFDWGLRGAEECAAAGVSVVAVVDVLSFTTAVAVAVERGIDVYPYRWRDESAVAYARDRDAVLAVGRSQAGPDEVSLSPVTLRTTTAQRVVLPSPNGSTIAQAMAGHGCDVVGVSLRNAAAAAAWVRDRIGDSGTVLAIAAGEHWPDGTLRPAVEDLWGAGAFLAALVGPALDPSPEVTAAVAAYGAMGDPRVALPNCASGRELVAIGYENDVDIAAELNVSDAVPLLQADRFTPA
jgi:2-phosphosulfolactate phosphatase